MIDIIIVLTFISSFIFFNRRVMEYARFDKVNENLLFVKFNGVQPSMEEFEKYLSQLKKYYEEFEDAFIIVFDSNASKYLNSSLRSRQAEWLKENDNLIRNKCLLSIYVINNPIIRFILEAIFLVQSSPTPYQVVGSTEQAQEIVENFFDLTTVSVGEVR